jgi:tetrahydromethanopterin S-methyltransferase subunit E
MQTIMPTLLPPSEKEAYDAIYFCAQAGSEMAPLNSSLGMLLSALNTTLQQAEKQVPRNDVSVVCLCVCARITCTVDVDRRIDE